MTESDNEPWIYFIKDRSLVTKETANLMLAECELALRGRIESLNSTTARADKLISIYIPIFTTLSVYCLANFKDIFSKFLVDSAFLALLVVIFGTICCYINIKKYVERGVGEPPKKIIRTEYIDGKSTDIQYTELCLATCINIQAKIEANDITIERRSNYNQWAIRLLFWIPLCPILVFLIAKLCSVPLCYF